MNSVPECPSNPPARYNHTRVPRLLTWKTGPPSDIMESGVHASRGAGPAGRMKSVSRFEANLLRLLYYFLQQAPVQQALPLLEAKIDQPRCLSRNAVELVEDALAKGCVLLLARLGGWRR